MIIIRLVKRCEYPKNVLVYKSKPNFVFTNCTSHIVTGADLEELIECASVQNVNHLNQDPVKNLTVYRAGE